jgi:hypothetical protein
MDEKSRDFLSDNLSDIASDVHVLKMMIMAELDKNDLLTKCVDIRRQCLRTLDKLQEVK